MAKNKYYAVRIGKKPGIYESWEECKKMIDGFSNAEYKSFAKIEDAELFIKKNNVEINNNLAANYLETVIAYIDGSYSDKVNRYSYGCILITPSGEVIRKSGYGNDPKALCVRNVAGELQGAMYAVKMASDLGFKRIIIRHDYVGISKWYTGEWRAKDEIAKIYIDFLAKMESKIEIIFEKVEAHSGDKYNDEADKLAKRALETNEHFYIKENKPNEQITNYDTNKTSESQTERDKLIKLILDSTMESGEVLEYLGISAQKLTGLNKKNQLTQIKKGIYLKSDVESLKKELND